MDYLIPIPPEELDGQTVLKHMLENSNMRLKELSMGIESSNGGEGGGGLGRMGGGGGDNNSVSSTLSTSALGRMLSERPHVAALLLEGLSDRVD